MTRRVSGSMSDSQDQDLLRCRIDRIKYEIRISTDRQHTHPRDICLAIALRKMLETIYCAPNMDNDGPGSARIVVC